MFDYASIKTLAESIGRPVTDLIALTRNSDPFFAGMSSRAVGAQWFAPLYRDYGGGGVPHLRRIHYRLVSPPEGVRILLPNGREYQNTENDWNYLCAASRDARYFNLIPFDGLADRRNDPPLIYATDADPQRELKASCDVCSEWTYFDKPELPPLPDLDVDGFETIQNYIIEIWIEKSTQNDWLDPLCKGRCINLVTGIGEQSEIRTRELAMRAAKYKAPVRVLYLSDFDPGGRSMPKAVARKVEFAIHKFGLNVDFQLIPLVLTPKQCRQYNLPRIPIKDTERRKDKFEQTFGVGATELDALEAIHPGELKRIVEEELNNWLDPNLGHRVWIAKFDQQFRCDKIVKRVREEYAEQIDELSKRFKRIIEELDEWEDEADELWAGIAQELEDLAPDLSDVEIPRSEAPGKTDRFVLFDSKRDYLTQMDHYNAWKDGGEATTGPESTP
jgi:hypothetical protein